MTDSTISIVAIGGSTRPDSSSERALRLAARGARDAGAHLTTTTGRDLMLPIFDTETSDQTPQALTLVEAIRSAHGLLVASPSYHGGISGMMKNALDYIEDLASHDPPIPPRSRRRLYRRRLRVAGDRLDAAAVTTDHPRAARLANTARCHHRRCR